MADFPRTVRTRRLTLRPFALADVDDVFAIESDPDYVEFLGGPLPYERDAAARTVASRTRCDWSRAAIWAIDLAGHSIGHVAMSLLAAHGRVDLSYGLSPMHWGKGYMTEVVRAAIDAAFTAQPQVNRIQADANPRNVASLRVMEKAGMQREGLLRQYVVIHGKTSDQVMCSIVHTDWEAARR